MTHCVTHISESGRQNRRLFRSTQFRQVRLAGLPHIPWLSKTLLQLELKWARRIWRHCCTALSSPRSLRQNRDASREHAACSCCVPACWAIALPPVTKETIKQAAAANTIRIVELQVWGCRPVLQSGPGPSYFTEASASRANRSALRRFRFSSKAFRAAAWSRNASSASARRLASRARRCSRVKTRGGRAEKSSFMGR